MVKIEFVEKGGIADKHGIAAGDYLISINGEDIKDVLDYRFHLMNKKLTLKIHREEKLFDVVIKKGEYDDIGLEFKTYLMDEKKSCTNKCVFCFIDQLPKGMRDTLYFKDDDSRLSFLMGNYITMTNMKDEDLDRIIKMRMSPVNVSVHTTNPELREKMLNNRFAGDILRKMQKLAQNGIKMNCQLVICKGLNDKEELERSMRDLSGFYPQVESVSIVPAGITKYRCGLYPLEPFNEEECREIVKSVEAFGESCIEKYGSRIFYPSDELYLKGGLEIPTGDFYEGYPQIENGVGMIASMQEEYDDEISYVDEYDLEKEREISIATGEAAYEFICGLSEGIMQKAPKTKIMVYKVENEFFGENITVAGLMCGVDVMNTLKTKDLGQRLLLPRVCFRREGDLMLDGVSIQDLEKELGVRVELHETNGIDFISAILN